MGKTSESDRIILQYLAREANSLYGKTTDEICNTTGISRATFYRILTRNPLIRQAQRPRSPKAYFFDDAVALQALKAEVAKVVEHPVVTEVSRPEIAISEKLTQEELNDVRDTMIGLITKLGASVTYNQNPLKGHVEPSKENLLLLARWAHREGTLI